MGDTTSMQAVIFDCPEEHVYDVIRALQNFGLGSDWDHASDLKSEIELGTYYVVSETSCGNSDQLAADLISISSEIAWEVWEDPKYEYLGDLHRYVPGLSYWSSQCDADGQPQFDATTLIEDVKSGKLTPETADDYLGGRWKEELDRLAKENDGKVVKQEDFADEMWAQLTKAGTACSETAYCDEHIDEHRVTPEALSLPARAAKTQAASIDEPVTAHVDASGNDQLRCQQCGKRTEP